MTTKLLRQVAEQDQAELAARHNQERRFYRSHWIIDRMRDYLAPEHITTAYDVRDLAARSRGIKLAPRERIDAGNGAEIALLSRLDAGRKLAGYHGAVTARLGASKCLYAIEEEYTLAETVRICGYAAGSHRSIRQLVQLTMMAAQDYADECWAQRQAWRAM